LNANHHLVVNQLQLGEHVDSPDATSLPVRFAISLLKDRDGVIDLELPVTGSLDDPKFRLSQIVWTALGHLLEKAVTSPFRLLGSLFGGGDELSAVDFAPGEPTLDAAARARLATLVKGLDARPGVSVDVPLGYAADIDTPALAERRWRADLETRATQRLGAGATAPGAVAALLATPASYRALLEDAYAAGFGHRPAPPPAAAASTSAGIAWLEQELKSGISIGPRQLEELAAARAGAVQSALLEGTGIDPSRVFIVKAPPLTAVEGRARLELVLH
jgi:hypothetical protein